MATKINWDRVITALKATCTKCGGVIKLNEIRLGNFEQMICPACGAIFDPLEKRKPDPSSPVNVKRLAVEALQRPFLVSRNSKGRDTLLR